MKTKKRLREQAHEEIVTMPTPLPDGVQDKLNYSNAIALPLTTVAFQCAEDPAFASNIPNLWALELEDASLRAHEMRLGHKLPIDVAALLLFRRWALGKQLKVVTRFDHTHTHPTDRDEADKCYVLKDDLAEFLSKRALPFPTFWTTTNSNVPAEQSNTTVSRQSAKQLPRQRHQEQEILRVIRELGHDPKALPKSPPGRKGVKAAVRARLTFPGKVFQLAWERLRGQCEIQDAT